MASNWLYNGDRHWYTRIIQKDGKQGLLDFHPLKYLEGKTVICYESPKKIRYYTVFETFLHFIFTLLSRPEDDRSFHEVIFGEFPLKLFFDLDVDLLMFPDFKEETMISEIVRAILAYFKAEGISLQGNRNFVWLTSHGEYKKSYHLVIDGYFFFNMDEVTYVVNQIKEVLSPEVREYVDFGVYASKKNIRTLGSYKRGESRKFIFLDEWKFEGKTLKYEYSNTEEDSINEIDSEKRKIVLQFEASLITNIGHCIPMISKVINIQKQYDEVPDCEDSTVQKGMEMLAKTGEVSVEELPFQITGVSGNFIILKRLAPTHCMICDRVHEHQNPFLRVKETPECIEYFYYCRRAGKGKGKLIGTVLKDKVNNKENPDKLKEISTVEGMSLKILQERRNPETSKEGAKRTNKSYRESAQKMLESI